MVKNVPGYRRAWALACHPRIRAGFPCHATIAGDRPPRYGKKRPFHRRSSGSPDPEQVRIAWQICQSFRRSCPTEGGQRSRGTGPRATGKSRPGGLSYPKKIETGRSLLPGKRNRSGALLNYGGETNQRNSGLHRLSDIGSRLWNI